MTCCHPRRLHGRLGLPLRRDPSERREGRGGLAPGKHGKTLDDPDANRLTWEEVAAHTDGRVAALAIWREGVEVGRAAGVAIEPVMGLDPDELLDPARADGALERMMERVGNTRPSMLQDLEAGRATEVEVVNGGVVRRGRELGVPTPWNHRVVALVHAMERGDQRPEARHLTELGGAQP